MGACNSRCQCRPRTRLKVAVIGLDNAGKSTVVHQIIGDYQALVMPTLGFSSFTTTSGRLQTTIFDLGGSSLIRKYWSNYYHELHGLIFVVDSADVQRLSEARAALHDAVADHRMAGKPILILANKQDLGDHLTADEISCSLDLAAFRDTPYCINGCIAFATNRLQTDPNIAEGLTWLQQAILRLYEQLERRAEQDTAEWVQRETDRKNQQTARVAAIKIERENLHPDEIGPVPDKAREGLSSTTAMAPLLPGQTTSSGPSAN